MRERTFVVRGEKRRGEEEVRTSVSGGQSDCSSSLCVSLLGHGSERWSCEVEVGSFASGSPSLPKSQSFHLQINLLESRLLMRTSSRRSLALTCLYSLYSSANGERSSFCTFLRGRNHKHRARVNAEPQGRNNDRSSELLFSPSVLPQELVLELLQILAQSLLLLSGFLELH